MRTLSEYDFKTIQITANTREKGNIDVYIKLIPQDRIKESIFCYWCLIYEEYFNKLKKDQFSKIINKVKITETQNELYKHSVHLSLNENLVDTFKNGSTIYFVSLNKYVEKNKKQNKNIFKNLESYLDKDSQDILFLATID